MDKRTLVALILTAIVIVATPLLFPTSRRATPSVDSSHITAPTAAADSNSAPVLQPTTSAPAAGVSKPIVADTIVMRTNRAEYVMANPGVAPIHLRLLEYRSLESRARRADRVDL